MRTRLTRLAGTTAALAGRVVKSIPGVAAMGCAVTGSALMFGTAAAFYTAAAFLVALAVEVN